jgi:hypothetical protein
MADPAQSGGRPGDLHALAGYQLCSWGAPECYGEHQGCDRRYGDCDETGEGLLNFENGVVRIVAGWVDGRIPSAWS